MWKVHKGKPRHHHRPIHRLRARSFRRTMFLMMRLRLPCMGACDTHKGVPS